MQGGLGNDIYVVDEAADVVTEAANAGTDTVQSAITYILGTNVENLTLTGTAAINGTGNTSANILIGNAGNNTLNAGAGADTMQGGLGNDIYVVDEAADVVTEAANAGTDKVQSAITYILGTNVENLSLTGTAAISGSGNTLANILVGNDGNNTLNGGAGSDALEGGGGNDIFIFNTALNAATNVDTIIDFSAVADSIWLENAVFVSALLTPGSLAATKFVANASGTAIDADDRIIYKTDSGKLFFDSNGSADGASVHFATISGMPTISADDFWIT